MFLSPEDRDWCALQSFIRSCLYDRYKSSASWRLLEIYRPDVIEDIREKYLRAFLDAKTFENQMAVASEGAEIVIEALKAELSNRYPDIEPERILKHLDYNSISAWDGHYHKPNDIR